jgi:hypothetical protein
MGWSVAPALFQQIMTPIVNYLQEHLNEVHGKGNIRLVAYLDDILISGLTADEVSRA